MKQAETNINKGEPLRPLLKTHWSKAFISVAIILIFATTSLILTTERRQKEFISHERSLIASSVRSAAREISYQITGLRRSVTLFAAKEKHRIEQLINNPVSHPLYQELINEVTLFFPDIFTITIANPDGIPIIESAEGFVGRMCRSDIHHFANNTSTPANIFIHSSANGGYHFDIMANVELSENKNYVFFVSFKAAAITKILTTSQLAGHHLFLVKKENDREQIEISATGAGNNINREDHFTSNESQNILFRQPVAETSWNLVDVSMDNTIDTFIEATWYRTLLEIIALFLFSGIILYLLRQSEKKITHQNSALLQQADELQQAGKQIIDILESMNDVYLSFDSHWQCTYVNAQAEKLLNSHRHDIVGNTIWDILPEFASSFYKRFQESLRHQVPLTTEGYYPPQDIWLDAHTYPTQNGLAVFLRNITAEKTAREHIKKSESKLRAILDNVVDGIISINRNKKIETFNPAAETIFKMSAAEAIGKEITSLISLPSPSLIQKSTHPSSTFNIQPFIGKTCEFIGYKSNGQVFPLELAISEVKTENNHLFIWIVRDITQRKNLEQKQQAQQAHLETLVDIRTHNLALAHQEALAANQAKTAFLANMSHELRTPLNAIIGYSEILLEDETNPQNITDLQKINNAGKHLLHLVGDILDLSKIEAGKFELCLESFSIPELLAEAVETIEPAVEKKGNTLDIIYKTNVSDMYTDKTRLKQILLNLLSNANKFTDHGSIVCLISSAQTDNTTWISYSIRDTGIGINRTKVSHLFKPFTRGDATTNSKYEGTGLGLAISQRFCQLMGGSISVESEPGQGSVFCVKLPAIMANQTIDKTNQVAETFATSNHSTTHLPSPPLVRSKQ